MSQLATTSWVLRHLGDLHFCSAAFMLGELAVRYGLATVARGTAAGVFVDASRVTLLSRGRSVIAALLVPLLAHDHVDALGGPARRHPSWHGG